MKKKLFLSIFLFFYLITNSQIVLSEKSEVSVITAGPGDELFEAFGHSAIRIKDPNLKMDIVYNYGIFDYDAPNFYLNFTKGKLLYKLGRYKFKYFLSSYNDGERWVKEQVLNINQEQKQLFFNYLENNSLPQNASYFYDPYFNNCASKIRDITTLILKDNVEFKDNEIEKNRTLRNLMNQKIHWNTWGSFGINLALGNKLDKKQQTNEYMYLPDYVYEIFKQSEIIENKESKKLIKSENILINYPTKKSKVSVLNPLLIFSIISLIGLLITYFDYKKQTRTKTLDFILFFITGIIGLVLVFLMFFTDHSTTPNNFNALWAFPLNIFISFYIFRNQISKLVLNYLKILIFLLFLIPIIWLTKIQSFPISVIPFLILLLVRYVFIFKTSKIN